MWPLGDFSGSGLELKLLISGSIHSSAKLELIL